MSKFSIYSYTGRDVIRPAVSGVFHDGGYKIATNTLVMVAIYENYAPDLEKKIIARDGSEITGCKFPRWREVIPEMRKNDLSTFVDTFAVRAFIRSRKGSGPVFVKIGSSYFTAAVILQVCKFLDVYNRGPVAPVYTFGHRPAAVKTADGSACVFMPAYVDFDRVSKDNILSI